MSQVLLYAALFLIALAISSFMNFIDRGVTRGRNVDLQREFVGALEKKYYDTENQMRINFSCVFTHRPIPVTTIVASYL